VWLVVRAIASRLPIRPVLASLALIVGLAAFGWWLNAEFRVGDAQLESIRRRTFAARMEHSAESRGRIRETLERTYARSPLGIGPGNSDALTVSIAERERKNSYQSKEAHSDYLAYAIERGPLGLAGLLVLTAMMFAQVLTFWKNRPRRGVHFVRASLWTASMSAALVASAVHSLVIEKLHFRHFWLLAAMVCASAHIARRRDARRHARGAEPARATTAPVGLPPHVPGRLTPALATTTVAPALPVTTGAGRSLPPAATPALARRYGSTVSSGEVVS
jgi:O-antigen ligase